MAIKIYSDPLRITLLVVLLIAWVFAFIPPGKGFDLVFNAYYAIAQSQRLSLGGVIPPFNSYIIFFFTSIFGENYLAYQVYTAVIISTEVYLLYLLVRALKGSWQTYLLTLAFCFPMFFLTLRINYGETTKIFWLITLLLYIYLIQSKSQRYLIFIGIITGFALLNKWDIIWLDISLLLGLLALKERRLLWSRHTIYALLFMSVIISPYLYWMYQHDFINLFYYTQYSQDITKPFWQYGVDLITAAKIITIPMWGLGLLYFYRNKTENTHRHIAIFSTILFFLVWVTKAPSYFMYPLYILLFLGGAKFILSLGNTAFQKAFRIILILYAILIFIINMIQLPFFNDPLFSKNTTAYLSEQYAHKPIGHGIVYEIGIQETIKQIAKIYHHQSNTIEETPAIWTESYVIASIIDYYKEKYHLPTPISADQDWYFWGIGHANTQSHFLYVGPLQFQASIPKPHHVNLRNYFNHITKIHTITVKDASKDLQHLNIWSLSGWKPHASFRKTWPSFANMSQIQ